MRHLPNILTALRGFFITPLLLLLFLLEFIGYYVNMPKPSDYVSVPFWGVALTIAGWTSDVLDGWLAKTFGWHSEFGARVDPLMDKWFTYTGYGIIPLWYGLGWYLVWMVPLCVGIHLYSVRVTRLRKERLISSANQWARWKSGVMFFAQFVMMLGIALPAYWYGSLLVAAVATCVSGLLCLKALSLYEAEADAKRNRASHACHRNMGLRGKLPLRPAGRMAPAD